MSKTEYDVHGSPLSASDEALCEDDFVVDTHVPEKYRGTENDKNDMRMLGKKQVLRRNFKGITMLGFASMVMVAWEALLLVVQYPLETGGPPVVFWGLLIAPFGLTFVYLSLAELASMSPTAGGQYHWVSEFSPPSLQKPLSYFTGWLIALGWQTWLTGTCFMAAEAMVGMIYLNDATYEAKRWHLTLLVIGTVVFSVVFNTFLAQRLPLIEGMLLILHVAGLFAICIPLWVMGPRANASDIILDVLDLGNWGGKGLSFMVGLPYMIAMLYGYDCVVHMAEETNDASKTIPPTILLGMWVNAGMMLIMGVTFIFTLGDLETVITSGSPFITVFLNATGSYAGTNVMAAIIVVTLVSACFSEVATASRQVWSFARDGGLPFSKTLATVSPGWNVPFNAVIVSILITTLLSLINIGSEAAFIAVNSLSQMAILSSYLITISCLIWRRLFGAPLPARRWSLGNWGLTVNIISVCFISPIFIFATFPLSQPVTLEWMNWSSLIFVGVLVLAAVYYVASARHHYVGPVTLVKRD